MKAWTDYPITELGDKPHAEAPIREVEIITYDNDKYCHVSVGGIYKEIKAGYLYKSPGRLGEVTPVNRDQLRAI